MNEVTADIALYLPKLKYIRNKKQEYFVCITLDRHLNVIARRTITIGLVDQALVHPRELFAGAISDRASCVIIAHNHPTGVAEPSSEDIEITKKLVAAGRVLYMPVLDHIIVTSNSYYSFKEQSIVI